MRRKQFSLFLITILAVVLLTKCGNNEAANSNNETENVKEEEATSIVVPISDVDSDNQYQMPWKDSIISVLSEESIDIKFVSIWDTIHITSVFDLWTIDSDIYKPFYWDDMDYRHMLGSYDVANKLALSYLKNKEAKSFFLKDVADQIYYEFNVLNFGRIGKNAKYYGHTYPVDIYPIEQSKITQSSITHEDSSWYTQYKVIEKADFNADGIMDLMVNVQETAKQGSYRGNQNIMLTKVAADSDIVYLPMEELDYHEPHKEILNKSIRGNIGEDQIKLLLNWTDGIEIGGEISISEEYGPTEVSGFMLGNGFTYLRFDNGGDQKSTIVGRYLNNSLIADFYNRENQTDYKIQLNNLPTIGEGLVLRAESKNLDNQWESVEIANIFGFKDQLNNGELVQVIPLREELPSLLLPVVRTKLRDEYDIWYEVDLELITDSSYWKIESKPDRRPEYPSDVLVVYPPIQNCKLLPTAKLNSSELPQFAPKEIIKGALDFDNDNKPDALVLEFCCKDRKTRENPDCDYTCGETYVKLNGNWIMTGSSQPL